MKFYDNFSLNANKLNTIKIKIISFYVFVPDRRDWSIMMAIRFMMVIFSIVPSIVLSITFVPIITIIVRFVSATIMFSFFLLSWNLLPWWLSSLSKVKVTYFFSFWYLSTDKYSVQMANFPNIWMHAFSRFIVEF